MPTMPHLDLIFAVAFGLIFGSFLNVCIARLPLHQSVVTPRSRCPHCKQPIAWYDNIPVASYLLLRGRCRGCRGRISAVYPAVELATAGLFAAAFAEFGFSPDFIKAVIFSMLMIVVFFTDINLRIIPHSVTITGAVLGVILSQFVPVNDGLMNWIFERVGITAPASVLSLAGAVAGALFGAGLLYGVAWCLRRFGNPEKEYLGFGDVMLMLMAGAFLGIPLVYVTLLLGSLAGTFIAIALRTGRKSYRGYEWPFGSFLAAAGIFALFYGERLIDAYLRVSRLG